ETAQLLARCNGSLEPCEELLQALTGLQGRLRRERFSQGRLRQLAQLLQRLVYPPSGPRPSAPRRPAGATAPLPPLPLPRSSWQVSRRTRATRGVSTGASASRGRGPAGRKPCPWSSRAARRPRPGSCPPGSTARRAPDISPAIVPAPRP